MEAELSQGGDYAGILLQGKSCWDPGSVSDAGCPASMGGACSSWSFVKLTHQSREHPLGFPSALLSHPNVSLQPRRADTSPFHLPKARQGPSPCGQLILEGSSLWGWSVVPLGLPDRPFKAKQTLSSCSNHQPQLLNPVPRPHIYTGSIWACILRGSLL